MVMILMVMKQSAKYYVVTAIAFGLLLKTQDPGCRGRASAIAGGMCPGLALKF